jgi:hypothetical protein
MNFISILKLKVTKVLLSLNLKLSSVYFTRISAIIFIYAGVLSFNTLYIQSIGSGIGIYSGLFHVTQIQPGDPILFLFIILILLVLSIIFILSILSLINKFYTFKPGSQTLNLKTKNKKLFWSLLFLLFFLFTILVTLQGLDISFNSINKPLNWLLLYNPAFREAFNFFTNSPNNNLELLYDLFETILINFYYIFKPEPVTGYLDDMIGQQIAIYFIIFFISVFLILLMIVYIVNILLLFNKEFI